MTAKAPSTLAVVGRYVLDGRIFDLLEKTTPGAGGENANLDLQLSRRDIALVDEAIRFETIVIDRQTDPAPSWIADLDNFFIGLGATGWQENVFGLFTTGTARVISLRQDDGVDMTHDGSIRFVDDQLTVDNVVAHGWNATHPHSLGLGRCDLVPNALGCDFALELRE